MGFNGGFEHINAQRAVCVGFHLFAGCVNRSGHIFNERNDVAKELHHAAHAHVFFGADAEERIYRAVDKTFADTHSKLVFREVFFLEEFLHESFVVLGCRLNECAVVFHSAGMLFSRDFLDSGSTSFRAPRVFLHQQDVDHGVEAGAADYRILHGHDFRTKDIAHLLEHVFIVGFLAVELVHGENHRFIERGSGAEDILSADLHAVLGVDKDNTRIGNVESRNRTAHEVIGTRAVDNIELLAKELGIEDS